MKQKRKVGRIWIGICLVLCIFINSTLIGYATRGASTMSIDATKTVTLGRSSGMATASCKVTGNMSRVTKITVVMSLQKQNNSGTWTTVKSWSGTANNNYYNFAKNISVSRGAYRVKANVTCYRRSVSKTSTHYSGTKSY